MKNFVDAILICVVIAEVLVFGFLILAFIKGIANKIDDLLHGNTKTPTFPITFFLNDFIIKNTGGITMLKMQNDQLARFVVGSPKDKKGEDATIEAGSLKVTSSNEEVFTLEPDENDPDNTNAFQAVAGRSGAAVLRIEADADLGEGVQTIFTEVPVEVTASEAVGFGEPTFAVEEQEAAGGGGTPE